MTTEPSIEEKLAEWEAEHELLPEQRNAVYVSAPLTTGPLYVAWRRGAGRDLHKGTPEFNHLHRSEVVLPNMQRAARFLEHLRRRHVGLLIDPTVFDVPGWTQDDFHRFWLGVIERHVRRVIFLDGWEYSNGCALEFQRAQQLEIDCVDERLQLLSGESGARLLRRAVDETASLGIPNAPLEAVARALASPTAATSRLPRRIFKDEILDRIAHAANVAQFVSFGPGPTRAQRFSRVTGFPPNHRFASTAEAVRVLLAHAPEGCVNIRSFDPARPEGNPLLKRLSSADDVLSKLHDLGVMQGLHTVVNESIDEHDGGVSGVYHRGLLDFAPDANPRCVEEDHETCALPFELGMRLLQQVYGVEPDLRGREGGRIEFSVHPGPRGWSHQHTIIWQQEQRPGPELTPTIHWPNDFSRFLGDKAFGLALAAALGLDVPRTSVFSTRLFPWTFGRSTGTREVWTRTAPSIKVPGYYPSRHGWMDPLAVLADPWVLAPEDRPQAPGEHAKVVSVLIQEGVAAVYSGRAKPDEKGDVTVHGVAGTGDRFMLGESGGEILPPDVVDRVRAVYAAAAARAGRVEIEWVFDGAIVWLVQMNAPSRARASSLEGDVSGWTRFHFHPGEIESYRRAVMKLRGTDRGIVVIGNVSPLSHLGEIAEVNNVPVRFVRE